MRGAKFCGTFSFRCPFSYNFSRFPAYTVRVSKAERNDTMKEKELDIRCGDVDDMIFGSEAYLSER